jgi:AAA+ ATPase superfamily predicted ATPase
MAFIGRQEELRKFEDRYGSGNAELIILYGRRRVGKTEFLRRFTEGKEAFFFSATESDDHEQRERFKQRMLSSGFGGEPSLLNDWEGIFRNLKGLKQKGKKLVIIDEFQHIFKGKKAVPSILQNIWDEHLSKENIMIVLCGSAMSFIENEVLGSKNPLYARASAIFKMKELTFAEASQFFPRYTLKDKVTAYSILGGIPFYLIQFSPSLSLEENIRRNILSRETVLYNEAEFIFKQEMREPATYNTLVSAIALGNTKLNDICQKTMIDAAKANLYLKNLIELNLVLKEYSILDTVKGGANVRNGLYRIADNFLRFWYRYVYPNKEEIELGNTDRLAGEIYESASTEHASACFEDLCIKHIRELNAERELPFAAKQIGKIWGKGFEADVGATDGRSLLIGECKWTNSKTGIEVLNGLKEKIAENTELKGYDSYVFYMFSRSGFTEAVKKEAERGGIVLITADDIFKT